VLGEEKMIPDDFNPEPAVVTAELDGSFDRQEIHFRIHQAMRAYQKEYHKFYDRARPKHKGERDQATQKMNSTESRDEAAEWLKKQKDRRKKQVLYQLRYFRKNRAKINAARKERRKHDSEYRKRWNRMLAATPSHKKMRMAQMRKKYKNNPKFREWIRFYNAMRWKRDKLIKMIERARGEFIGEIHGLSLGL